MLYPFHVKRIKIWFLSKKFTTYIKQREGTTLALLIKNVLARVSSMCSLTVSASDKDCHVFVWLFCRHHVKAEFQKSLNMTLQVFTGSF